MKGIDPYYNLSKTLFSESGRQSLTFSSFHNAAQKSVDDNAIFRRQSINTILVQNTKSPVVIPSDNDSCQESQTIDTVHESQCAQCYSCTISCFLIYKRIPMSTEILHTSTHAHSDHCPTATSYHHTQTMIDHISAIYPSKMHVLRSLITTHSNPSATQAEAEAKSQPEKETVQIIQHREVAMPDYHTRPTPALLKRCRAELRSLSPKDDICDIPRIFKLLDNAFFDGRVGKVASVSRTKSKPLEMVAAGGRWRRDAKGIVIHLPSHGDKRNSQDLVTILLREMAYIDFHEINTCHCEGCRSSDGLTVSEFVEYLTRLDGVVNFCFKTFESRWEIMTPHESSLLKKVIAALQNTKSFQQKAFYTEMVDQLERRHSIS